MNSAGDQGDTNPGNGTCATTSGACTLRAAIEEANANSGPDTIVVPAMTIAVNSELRIQYRYGVNTSVTIQGAGEAATIIDGNQNTRIFYFDARSGNHAISDITIQNAKNNRAGLDGSGGGIFSEAQLTLTRVTVTNNEASQGAGIYSQHAFSDNVPNLVLNWVTIILNTATTRVFGMGGGGIYSGSMLSGHDVVITDNRAALQGGGLYHNSLQSRNTPSTLTKFLIGYNMAVDGAGIDNDLGDLDLSNGSIIGNVATGCRVDGNCVYTGGAGLYNNEGVMELVSVAIRDNIAAAPGGLGGGIYNYGEMMLRDVAVYANRGATGAGVFNGNEQNAANSMTLINVTVSGNVGVSSRPPQPYIDAIGAGIYNLPNAHLALTNSTVSGNSAVVGGGIYNRPGGTVTLLNTIVANNTDEVTTPDCYGTIISSDYNLIGSPGACSFSKKAHDLVNTNPGLAPLVGDPAYHALLSNSPAIDAGTNINCPQYDQLGKPRPNGTNCDMGSFEFQHIGSIKIFLPLTIR